MGEEQFEKILETLEQNNIDVLRISDDEDEDAEIILSEEDEVDMENIDLSVPDGVSIIKFLHSFNKTKISFLNQIKEEHSPPYITLCNADYQT